jgi:integrase
MHIPVIEGTSPEWAGWVERWHATSPLTPKVRAIIRTIVAKAGRWLAAEHPGITEPGQWTRQTCAAWVAAVDRMAVGDYVQRRDHLHGRAGKPVAPRTKAHILMATRTFFRDCQEWEWFPRRFDPTRALALPRSVGALIGTDPRVIADDVWAKLLHAGLNIEAADLPGTSAGSYYPMELIRALTLTWLFSGLRSDEISRLRTGCIRWQHDGMPIPGNSREILAADAVCLLDIPVNKTGTAFTKPVDPIIGQAIEAWQAQRPAQPPWSTPGLVETRFSPDALVWVAVVFHGTAAWRNHGLIIFRFCFIEHLSSCAVQLSRLMAGCARRAAPWGAGHLLVGHPFCAAGSPGWSRVTLQRHRLRRRRRP